MSLPSLMNRRPGSTKSNCMVNQYGIRAQAHASSAGESAVQGQHLFCRERINSGGKKKKRSHGTRTTKHKYIPDLQASVFETVLYLYHFVHLFRQSQRLIHGICYLRLASMRADTYTLLPSISLCLTLLSWLECIVPLQL